MWSLGVQVGLQVYWGGDKGLLKVPRKNEILPGKMNYPLIGPPTKRQLPLADCALGVPLDQFQFLVPLKRAGACRATTGPDPHDVERHHAARGRLGERKRVGGGCDGSCYANSTAMRRLVLRDQGAPKYCSENKNCVRVFFVAQVCVALRSVIAVAGKFASILICGLAA